MIEKIAKAINFGNRTASTALVEYNNGIMSNGNPIRSTFTMLTSDWLF